MPIGRYSPPPPPQAASNTPITAETRNTLQEDRSSSRRVTRGVCVCVYVRVVSRNLSIFIRYTRTLIHSLFKPLYSLVTLYIYISQSFNRIIQNC